MNFKELIREIPDFPQTGICFRDITTLLKNGQSFHKALALMTEIYINEKIDIVVAPEARGFIVGAPMAFLLGAGFVPVRKPGKLPAASISYDYTLEYGQNSLEMHIDSIERGQRVLIADDLLATGGTIKAVADLVERLGGQVAGISFLIELTALKGRDTLANYNVFSLIQY